MVRFKFHLLVLFGLILFIFTIPLLSPVKAQAEQARSADTFVDSIGVAVHLRYQDTAYGKYDDIIKPRLQNLGVRHIRDGGNENSFFEKLNDLAKIGIRSTLVMDPRDGVEPSNAVRIAKTVANSVEAIEGPNETDFNSFSYKGKPFPEGTRLYHDALYSAIKRDRATRSLPVLMPSLGWAPNSPTLGSLRSCDVANLHSYPGKKAPTNHLDTRYIPNAQIVCSNKPMISTETGYQNAITNPTATRAVSEQASGKYLPRLLLEYFNRNIQQTFLYELIDEKTGDNPEHNFGLLRHDGSTKPAFRAIRRMIRLLKDNDPGPTFSPGSLDYQLSGDLTNIHHTLLQKRDGTFYLILWQEVESWDSVAWEDIVVADQPLTVTFNTAIREADLYRPFESAESIDLYPSPQQIALNVPDHPLVLKLTPG